MLFLFLYKKKDEKHMQKKPIGGLLYNTKGKKRKGEEKMEEITKEREKFMTKQEKMEEITMCKEKLEKEKEKMTAGKADRMEILDLMREIERTEWCEEFVRKYGEEIRIPCGENFSLIIDPWLHRKSTGVYGTFVLNSDMEDFLYSHLLDSHSDLGEWFDELCQNLFFGIHSAPVLTQNISDIEKATEFYKSEKAGIVYMMIDSYLNFLIEANPESVDDFDFF